jgi:poly(A) polymerase Pap1
MKGQSSAIPDLLAGKNNIQEESIDERNERLTRTITYINVEWLKGMLQRTIWHVKIRRSKMRKKYIWIKRPIMMWYRTVLNEFWATCIQRNSLYRNMKGAALYLVSIESYSLWKTAQWLLAHPVYDGCKQMLLLFYNCSLHKQSNRKPIKTMSESSPSMVHHNTKSTELLLLKHEHILFKKGKGRIIISTIKSTDHPIKQVII